MFGMQGPWVIVVCWLDQRLKGKLNAELNAEFEKVIARVIEIDTARFWPDSLNFVDTLDKSLVLSLGTSRLVKLCGF